MDRPRDLEQGHDIIYVTGSDYAIFTGVGLLLFLALHICMLVVGIAEKDECPMEKKIPTYLLVSGAVGIISKILPLINHKLGWICIDFILALLYLFELVWTVAGSFWVYSIFKPNFDKEKGPYCSEIAYILSFSLLTIHWVLVAMCIVFVFCIFCISVKRQN